MKKHQKILLILTILLILLSGIIVYAQTQISSTENVEVVTNAMLNSSSEILNTLNSNSSISKTDVIYDELRQENIYKISNEKYTINLDESNNLIGIYSTSINEITARTASTKDSVQSMIINKYNDLNLPSEYELVYLEKFDDQIWQANFEKNYNGVYNKYESVKVFFIPENDEIVALTVFNEGSDSSTVTVSQEQAISTATTSLNIDSSDIVSASLSMEKANNYYDESSTDTSVHTSWVLQTADNNFVYVDASDNTIIGGDCINE